MRAELRGLDSPDLPSFPSGGPDDPLQFTVMIEASIGVVGQPGVDAFSLMVSSPSDTDPSVTAAGYIWIGRRLVVSRYDVEVIRRAVANLCDGAEGRNWRELAEFLGRSLYCEFDSYDAGRT